ncbi:MAG: helix-turn-helix domain-containing protein [Planctomycetota bacterium]|jgi:excisionase family DNA binding protein
MSGNVSLVKPQPKSSESFQEPLLLTVPEVAHLMGLSDKTVRREVVRGNLRTVRLGRSVRISRAELLSYIKRNERRGYPTCVCVSVDALHAQGAATLSRGVLP